MSSDKTKSQPDCWAAARIAKEALSRRMTTSTDTSFKRQTLGNKLVQAGVLDIEELEQLLEDYRPFAETQRFGEFLRLNLQVPPQMLDLLLKIGRAHV